MAHPKIHVAGDVLPPLNMLLYGPNGAGKTHFAGTSGGLFINVEQGETTLVSAHIKVPVWDITEFDEWEEVYDHLVAHPKEYPCVTIDSYTDLAAKCLESVIDEAETRDGNRLTDAAELRDHGRVTLKLGKVLRRFRDLPMPVILICGVRDPDDQDRRYRPSLPASISRQARDYMDMIGYMSVVEEEDDKENITQYRKLRFYSPSGVIVCKDRNGVFTMETGRQGVTDTDFPGLIQFLKDNAPKEEKKTPAKSKRSVRKPK
ncbi:hypothetical protein LCGC14_2305290 [marine sediment metagenome]|uniref:Uncharacterized protein n=1 Tax=marine sediment metagenome TaxID=412755 RepID=A0A0F9CM95_9ZZZZ